MGYSKVNEVCCSDQPALKPEPFNVYNTMEHSNIQCHLSHLAL
jgi:hypothetical protein